MRTNRAKAAAALAATLAAAVLAAAGGGWLGADEPDTPTANEAQAVSVELEASPPTVPATVPAAEPPAVSTVERVAEPVRAVQAAEPWVADPLDLAPWPPPVGLAVRGEETAETAGLPAWRRFAVPAPAAPDGSPAIAILIDDMGVARAWSKRAIDLPGPLTLAFFPHAPDLAAQAAAARRAGHELMLHMPMEPDEKAENPGPAPLLIGLDEAELRRRLAAMLDSFVGYVGINNHMGSRFTRDAAAMRTVLAEIKARGLLFVDSRTTTATTGERLARELGVPTVRRDVFIDNESGGIGAQLAALEALARERGFAVGIAHPRPRTLDALAAWLPEIVKRGVTLVPISTVVARGQGIDLAATRGGNDDE